MEITTLARVDRVIQETDMTTSDEQEPKRLDTEDVSGDEVKKAGEEALEQSSHINATREEAAWEAQAEGEEEDDGDDRYPTSMANDIEIDEDVEQEEEVRRRASSSSSTLDDVILYDIPKKSGQAGHNLRAELAGAIKLKFKAKKKVDGGDYIFRWDGDEASTQKIEDSSGNKEEVDCEISIHSEDFFDIVRGKLNPQVAMLSDKIYVKGKLSLAVYFFNLFAI